MQNTTYTRYGEAFKRQVVAEIENGKFSGATAAARAYGIKGGVTVQRWLRKYGREEFMPKKVTVTTMKEQDEVKALKKRVKDLESALADSYMSGLLSESYLEIACEDLGIDVDTFKKKHVTNLSDGPSKKEGK